MSRMAMPDSCGGWWCRRYAVDKRDVRLRRERSVVRGWRREGR